MHPRFNSAVLGAALAATLAVGVLGAPVAEATRARRRGWCIGISSRITGSRREHQAASR